MRSGAIASDDWSTDGALVSSRTGVVILLEGD